MEDKPKPNSPCTQIYALKRYPHQDTHRYFVSSKTCFTFGHVWVLKPLMFQAALYYLGMKHMPSQTCNDFIFADYSIDVCDNNGNFQIRDIHVVVLLLSLYAQPFRCTI